MRCRAGPLLSRVPGHPRSDVRLLANAFRLPSAPPPRFADIGEADIHLPGIAALAAAGITSGCAVDPARYCPGRPTTRAQMATFLVRALQVGDSSTPTTRRRRFHRGHGRLGSLVRDTKAPLIREESE